MFCYSAGFPVVVGLTDVTPPNYTPMGLEEFDVEICGIYDSVSSRTPPIDIECSGQFVVGRYLVLHFNVARGGLAVCEILATVEGIMICLSYIDGLAQDCGSSSLSTTEHQQSC